MKILFIMLLCLSYTYSADTLIDALMQGTFDKKIALEPTDGEDARTELNKQKVIFHYLSAPIRGIQLEVKNDGLVAYAKAMYRGKISDFGYSFSANGYTTNTSSYTMDVNYNLKRELTIGSRYTYMNELTNTISYAGIYSSLILDEISKGLNVSLYYDKAEKAKENDKFSLKIKNNF
ncbi:MAG: hypothetical protein PHN18_01885 [Sulfurospirillaceae bacterium]|nr:hypothetical protein [Sulfurospirillaceae bacterium]MDD2826541.1 hypothetical protein [Sulfurospirillaceae bacterium]